MQRSIEVEHYFTDREVRDFANLTGDRNPIHLDDEFAKNSVFGQRVVHGMLTAGKFSYILGQVWPGEGTIYLEQTLQFKRPVFLNSKVTFKFTLSTVREDKPIATIHTVLHLEDGTVAIDGKATVLLPKHQHKSFSQLARAESFAT